MALKEQIDSFLEEAIAELYPPNLVARMLLSEDFVLDGENVRDLTKQELLEARRYGPKMQKRRVQRKRVIRKVQGGGRVLIRRLNKRKDPGAIRRGKLAAIKGKAARRRAARNPATIRKRKRTMLIRKQLGLSKNKRGAFGAHRHGPPRRHPYHPHRPPVRRR